MNHNFDNEALKLHAELGGKIRVTPARGVKTREELAVVYTPGVGAVSKHVAEHPEDAAKYTQRGRMIAVVSDGSAVLGLGNIGPFGALPVMEGKAVLFKEFADVDAVPIVLDVHTPDEIVAAVKAIAPSFAGINLEDIKAPEAFEVEERLKDELDIPVMHDDQHGTAIVTLAGLINAAKVTGRNLASMRVVVNGAGAAGTAIAKLLVLAGIKDVVVLDTKGILRLGREHMNEAKNALAGLTNPRHVDGGLSEALTGADVIVGVSGPNSITSEHVKLMNKDAIVFALANPVPEIMPEEAYAGGAKVVATGRSDFPNQINNALVFPGVFRGALDNKVKQITDAMKVAAATAIAELITAPTADNIIPDVFDPRVVKAVANTIR
jgi:malate dehydrogenase (oxaloacetate-decarboxylating)